MGTWAHGTYMGEEEEKEEDQEKGEREAGGGARGGGLCSRFGVAPCILEFGFAS